VAGSEPGAAVEVGLSAAIVAVERLEPLILVTCPERPGEPVELPHGPFSPRAHRTMEMGLRGFVEAQTALDLAYVEQLYTFGDRGRHARPGDTGPHIVSVGYLALVRPSEEARETIAKAGARFLGWYIFFPWEDWRAGRPAILDEVILPALDAWCRRPPEPDEPPRPLGRGERIRLVFGGDGVPHDEERVLERYELLYEAGLVAEACADGRPAALEWQGLPPLGRPMRFDHRRILATAISRLRAKLKYRPVVFELMPDTFTLTELQQTVEAISGRHLHKQNFRRLVDQTRLVEPTGRVSAATGGRPAALYRFRRDIVKERPQPGLRLGARA